MALAEKKCKTATTSTIPLEGKELAAILEELGGGWLLINDHHIEKEFSFKNFKDALDFTNKVAALSENENHHPDLHLSYGKVRVILWTHSINGLSESDFILASKIDKL